MFWAKVIPIFLLSAVKLLFAPGTSVAAGFNFWETFAITSAGGMTGILVFYFFGRAIFMSIDDYRERRQIKKYGEIKPKSLFTRRNRLLIHLKGKFGLIGLALLTPAIISIPIGCVVAAKFFYRNNLTLPLLLASTILWCFLLSYFAVYIEHQIFMTNG
jgi:membrane protein DedA with SNARE-associated domain